MVTEYRQQFNTSNLLKDHVKRGSISAAACEISVRAVGLQRAIKMCFW